MNAETRDDDMTIEKSLLFSHEEYARFSKHANAQVFHDELDAFDANKDALRCTPTSFFIPFIDPKNVRGKKRSEVNSQGFVCIYIYIYIYIYTYIH